MERSHDQESSAGAPAAGPTTLQAKAEQGDPDAQFTLGLRWGSAEGPAHDFAQAAHWYRQAADQDHALAQYNLAVMFARGQGVPRNDALAADWMRKAAEGGDAGAQYDMGLRCHRASLDAQPLEAAESRIEAYKWLNLAAAQGYRDSETAWQRITLVMTREEVLQGNQRTAAFVARMPAVLPVPMISNPVPPSPPAPSLESVPGEHGSEPAAPAPTPVSEVKRVKVARILDEDSGGFGLEYDNTCGQKNRMRLDARTYEGAIREARSYLAIQANDRDDDGDLWTVE